MSSDVHPTRTAEHGTYGRWRVARVQGYGIVAAAAACMPACSEGITAVIAPLGTVNHDVGMDIDEYCVWLRQIVTLCVEKTNPQAYILLCQTDRMTAGQWVDKTTVINQAARDAGALLRWKKIVLRNKWKTVELQNPTYSHVLCLSVQKGPGKKDLPDVVVGGPVVGGYCYGTPVCAVKLMFDFLQRWGESKINQIVDPFVGRGTTLAMAEKYGFSCVGVDIDSQQCICARALTVADLEKYL